ncbi:MAG: hypothetical protein QOF65_2683 [Thermoleophilaceae bacterium]|jgi:uncharacterized protein YbaP (TraB family)|nr:hypothetical protein [Thermoleophilaceae bacterium]MEA2438127.1 hypothetical protein [Thermoleophilaceae bacterium]
MAQKILTPLAAALLAVVVVVAGSAIAANSAKTTTLKLQGTVHAHAVEGGKVAGTVSDKYARAGAMVFESATPGKGVTTPFRAFGKAGTFKGTATADNTINPDLTVTVSNCTLKITGGSGNYAHAKGSGTCGGKVDAQGNFTLNYKGTAKVPK